MAETSYLQQKTRPAPWERSGQQAGLPPGTGGRRTREYRQDLYWPDLRFSQRQSGRDGQQQHPVRLRVQLS